MIDNKRFKEMMDYLKKNKYIRNQQDFVERVNSDKATVSQIMNDKISTPNIMFGNISTAFPFISIEWLKHGEGEMLSPASNIMSGNTMGDNNQVAIGGHNINLSAPKAEELKIIKPDGTVETYTSSHSKKEVDALKAQLLTMAAELEQKKIEVISLEKIIAAKDETISILKNEHNKK